MLKYVKINEKDNVIVALKNLDIGESLEVGENLIKVQELIHQGHKMAIKKIEFGEFVVKYGAPIGHAISAIEPGQWVHVHNTKTNLTGTLDYSYSREVPENLKKETVQTFKGYKRSNGQVGIRNELWIVPTVGCVNGIASQMIEKLRKICDLTGIDAIEVFKHNYGCSQLGEDHENTQKILADIAMHPNAGGVLILGLGCENNQVESMMEFIDTKRTNRIKTLVVQEVQDEIQSGVEILTELANLMKTDIREDVPVSKLKIGLKCGGSDGLSGITANPLLGVFSDMLISQGGTTILTEVPEMFGAEQILMNRCIDNDVFIKTVKLINDFKDYFIEHKQPIYENPSPGNKKGGITTLEDKSLGCTQKSGSAPVVDVLKYGDQVIQPGLNLLSAPGNDLVASTALGASGCHLVLFTTGRGTPFGSFVPTVKISSNTELYNKKPHWIDFNGGVLVEGEKMEMLSEDFLDYVIKVSSGTMVNNEINNIREIAILKTGVTL